MKTPIIFYGWLGIRSFEYEYIQTVEQIFVELGLSRLTKLTNVIDGISADLLERVSDSLGTHKKFRQPPIDLYSKHPFTYFLSHSQVKP